MNNNEKIYAKWKETGLLSGFTSKRKATECAMILNSLESKMITCEKDQEKLSKKEFYDILIESEAREYLFPVAVLLFMDHNIKDPDLYQNYISWYETCGKGKSDSYCVQGFIKEYF